MHTCKRGLMVSHQYSSTICELGHGTYGSATIIYGPDIYWRDHIRRRCKQQQQCGPVASAYSEHTTST